MTNDGDLAPRKNQKKMEMQEVSFLNSRSAATSSA